MALPSYLRLNEKGELIKRAEKALALLKNCSLCPRKCGVNRTAEEKGFCQTGRKARVASYGPHFGEEKPLVGNKGSGTIFFSSCNLLCSFCQNYDISHLNEGMDTEPEQLASIMLALQKRGCCNINLVTPSHVIPQILEALGLASARGLQVPLVYNTGGYDSLQSLEILDGIVDIYMPDFKFWKNETAKRFCGTPDYRERAVEGLKEMHRQVGELVIDSRGIAIRGLLVRHLVMPGNICGTREIMNFIARHISQNTYVNIMDQYRPCGNAYKDSTIGKRVSPEEILAAVDAARKAGLKRIDRDVR